jgi:hypothetical protein
LNGVIHLSLSAKGTVNVQFTGTGTFTFTPFDPAGVVYVGRATSWSGVNLNVANAQGTATFHVTATGSDGSTVKFQATVHFTAVGEDLVVVFGLGVCA